MDLSTFLEGVDKLFFMKRTLVYTTFGNEKYLKMASKLAAAGINFKTKSRSNSSFMPGHNTLPLSSRDKTIQYDIYVKKEDEYKAYQIIHNNW